MVTIAPHNSNFHGTKFETGKEFRYHYGWLLGIGWEWGLPQKEANQSDIDGLYVKMETVLGNIQQNCLIQASESNLKREKNYAESSSGYAYWRTCLLDRTCGEAFSKRKSLEIITYKKFFIKYTTYLTRWTNI